MNNLVKRLRNSNILRSVKKLEKFLVSVNDPYSTEAASFTASFPGSVIYCKHESTNVQPFKNLQSPGGKFDLPYIGLLFHFKPIGKYTSATFHKFLHEMNNKYGKIVKQRIGQSWMVFLFDPDDIEHVFRDDEKYPYRPESPLITCYAKRKGIEPGMAFQNGEEWSALRKPTQEKLLKPSAVAKYIPMIETVADDFVSIVGRKGILENTFMEMSRFTTETTGMLCFDQRLNCLEVSDNIKDILPTVLRFLDDIGESFDRVPWYKMFPTKFYRKFEDEYDEIQRIAKQKLDEAMENITRQKLTEGNNLTFLQSLLKDPRLTTTEIYGTVVDLFITGIDSTANTLTFLLRHLAENQCKQDILYKEIKQNIDPAAEMGEMTFRKTPYLKACLKESHRLVSPLRDGARRILDKDTIVGGYRVPKGNQLVFCNNTICLNEKYFPNPHEFQPERWLRNSTDRASIHPFALLPFGYGPRSCIGQRFAEQETYILITKLLQNYRIRLPAGSDEITYTYKLFATPEKPFRLHLEKR